MKSSHKTRHAAAAIFVIVVCVLLALPSIWHLLAGPRSEASQENRRIAKAPALPESLGDVPRFTTEADTYLRDNFGFRDELVNLNGSIWQGMFGETTSDQIVVGEKGRIFFGSHQPGHPYSLILDVCGNDVPDEDVRSVSRELDMVLESRQSEMRGVSIMIVPTAPALYPEQLPGWLRVRCAQSRPTAERLVEALSKDARARMIYPIAEMKALKELVDVIPKTNFHWYGHAPHQVARDVASSRFELSQTLTIQDRLVLRRSDIAHLNPGAQWSNSVMEPDFAAAQVKVCRGIICLPALTSLEPPLVEASRYVRMGGSNSGRKLLLLSDSFGTGIAGYFIEFFDEVVHLNVSDSDMLNNDQIASLVKWRVEQEAQVTLLMVHDGGFRKLPRLVKGLWPQ